MTAKVLYQAKQGQWLSSPHRQVPPRADLKWVALDHDGTMFKSTWTQANPTADIGEPIWDNFLKALDLIDAGFKLVVHTARPWADYEALESAYAHYGLDVRAIVCGKLLAVAYVDDRAVHADHPDWLSAVREIEESH